MKDSVDVFITVKINVDVDKTALKEFTVEHEYESEEEALEYWAFEQAHKDLTEGVYDDIDGFYTK